MKVPDADESPEPRKLLDFWMGGLRLDSEPPRRSGTAAILATAALSIAGLLLLAKYAADILVLLVPIAIALAALHLVLQALMRSTLLSPGWLMAGLLVVGLFAWLFVPNDLFHEERWIPRPIVRILEWSQTRGWGHTALSPDRAGGPETAPAAADSGEAPFELALGGATVTLSASQPSSAPGEPIVLTARLPDDVPASAAGLRVRFYDGATELGTAAIGTEWGSRVAHLTVTTLAAGDHQITAEIVGSSGGAGARSAPLRHVVAPASGR